MKFIWRRIIFFFDFPRVMLIRRFPYTTGTVSVAAKKETESSSHAKVCNVLTKNNMLWR